MKKAVKDLGNDVIHIDCCCKGCMLLFEEDLNLDGCKFVDLWDGKGKHHNRGIKIH